MLWLKAFHLIFMVTWFAGLFYLPRLYVYHTMADDAISIERFKIMERKLFWGIATPGALLTLLFGIFTLAYSSWSIVHLWLQIKLGLIGLIVIYHFWCGKLMLNFKYDRNTHSHIWYRWFNEIPVVFLIAIILLATLKRPL